jgi:hypothetical protein
MLAPSLRELQLAFGLAVARREDGGVIRHVLEDGIGPAARLDVYRNTFAATLARALRLAYPAVERLVGARFFEAAAGAFIEEEPPRSACLDDYGAGYAGFLERYAPTLDYLPGVARLECAVNRALHAADAAPLDPARLAALTTEEMARVRFAPHPSASLLGCAHPADAIWRAVLEEDEAALAAIDPAAGPAWLIVHRAESGVEVERLAEDAWRFSEALCAGQPLHRALEDAPCAQAQAVLAAHLAAGRFCDFGFDGAGGGR